MTYQQNNQIQRSHFKCFLPKRRLLSKYFRLCRTSKVACSPTPTPTPITLPQNKTPSQLDENSLKIKKNIQQQDDVQIYENSDSSAQNKTLKNFQDLAILSKQIRSQQIELTPENVATTFICLGKARIAKTSEDQLYFLSKLLIYRFRHAAHEYGPRELTDITQGICQLLQGLEKQHEKQPTKWVKDLYSVIVRLLRQTDFFNILRQCFGDKIKFFNQIDCARALHGIVGLNIFDTQLMHLLLNTYLAQQTESTDPRGLSVLVYSLGKYQNKSGADNETNDLDQSLTENENQSQLQTSFPIQADSSIYAFRTAFSISKGQKSQLSQIIINTCPNMSVWSISNVFIGFAYLGWSDCEEVLAACSNALIQLFEKNKHYELTEQQISNMFWASAKLKFYHPELVTLLQDQFKQRIKKYQLIERVQVDEGWSLQGGQSKEAAKPPSESTKDDEDAEQGIEKVTHPQWLCTCLWSIQEFRSLGIESNVQQGEVIQTIKSLILQNLSRLTPLDICTVLYSLAQMHDFDMELFFTLFQRANVYVEDMTSFQIAIALWACSKFHEQKRRHYSFFVCQYAYFDFEDGGNIKVEFKGLRNSLLAFEGLDFIIFSTLKHSVQLMVQLINQIQYREFDARGISMCIWSMAMSRIKIENTLEYLCQQIRFKYENKWDPQQIQNVLFGLALLGYVDPRSVSYFDKFLQNSEFLSGCSIQVLSNICWSLNLLEQFNPDTHQGILDKLAQTEIDKIFLEERNQIFQAYLMTDNPIREACWSCFSDKFIFSLKENWQHTLQLRIQQSAMFSSSTNFEVMQTVRTILQKEEFDHIFQGWLISNLKLVGTVRANIRENYNCPVQMTNIGIILRKPDHNLEIGVAIDLVNFENLLACPWAEIDGVLRAREKIFKNFGWQQITVFYHQWSLMRTQEKKIDYLVKRFENLTFSVEAARPMNLPNPKFKIITKKVVQKGKDGEGKKQTEKETEKKADEGKGGEEEGEKLQDQGKAETKGKDDQGGGQKQTTKGQGGQGKSKKQVENAVKNGDEVSSKVGQVESKKLQDQGQRENKGKDGKDGEGEGQNQSDKGKRTRKGRRGRGRRK